MSFQILFGAFSKKLNSTKLPISVNWYETSAVWKKEKSINAPEFEISIDDDSDISSWNYAVIPAYQRYYWVSKCVSVRQNFWRIQCTLDPLATYRDYILSTPGYILYGFGLNAGAPATRVPDRRVSISKVPQVSSSSVPVAGPLLSPDRGTYILSAVGASGGVSCYALTVENLRGLLDEVTRDIGDAITDFTSVEEILKYLTLNSVLQGSAISAIRSCIWLPIDSGTIPTGRYQPVYLGDFNTGVTAPTVDNGTIVVRNSALEIPWPVENWYRNNCQILLYVPCFGTVAIPVDQCNNASVVNVSWCVECMGGGVSCRVDCGDYTAYVGSGTIGCSYAIGSSNVPIQNVVSGAVQIATGYMEAGSGVTSMAQGALTLGLGADIGGGIRSIASGAKEMVNGAIQTITPIVQCSGTMSGNASLGQSTDLELYVFYYPPIDAGGFAAQYGYPVMRVGRPPKGYCQTQGYSVEGPIPSDIAAAINAAMDSGVFIE